MKLNERILCQITHEVFSLNNHDERGFHYSYPIIVDEIKCNFQTRNDNHQRGYGN